MSKTEELLDRKIKVIRMIQDFHTIKSVFIGFTDAIDVEANKGEDESRTKTGKYNSDTTFSPHLDFINAMKALLDDAFEIMEMNIVKSEKKDYAVLGISISGDLFLNQSRIVLQMGKRVHRSEKISKWSTPQVTLSDESKYLGWKSLQKKVELVMAEAWEYIRGKHADDNVPLAFQLELGLHAPKAEKKKKNVVPEDVLLGQPATA